MATLSYFSPGDLDEARSHHMATRLAPDALDIFEHLAAAARRRERGVLIILSAVTGGSPRTLGSCMAVLESGLTIGSLSSGCVEAAIKAEALDTLAAGEKRRVRFGQGSPYIDIRLPCGSGMDLLFTPLASTRSLADAAQILRGRVPACVTTMHGGGIVVKASIAPVVTGWTATGFVARYRPRLRLIVLGAGHEALAVASLATLYGADVRLICFEQDEAELAIAQGFDVERFLGPSALGSIDADQWTAVVLLYHDHDREVALIERALSTPAFWIGAMGSRSSHAARIQTLAERGVEGSDLERLRGPIGLIPAARDPATLALSALADIVATYAASET